MSGSTTRRGGRPSSSGGSLDRSRWGEGLATEAARLAAAWAWETLEVDQLIHLIRPDNHASIRVAERLGAAFDHRMDIDGGPVEVYALAGPAGMQEATAMVTAQAISTASRP